MVLDLDHGRSHSNLFSSPDTILHQVPRVRTTEEIGPGLVPTSFH